MKHTLEIALLLAFIILTHVSAFVFGQKQGYEKRKMDEQIICFLETENANCLRED